MGEVVQVSMRGAPGRCAYCHGDVSSEERVACRDCLAPHHQDCFHERCASCGSASVLVRGAPISHVDAEARKWAAVCHIVALAQFVFPFGHIIGPYIAWVSKRSTSDFVERQGREALNFQLTVSLAYVFAVVLGVGAIAVSIAAQTPVGLVGFLAAMVVSGLVLLWWFVFTIVATIQASNGKDYRYPFTIRFLRAARPVVREPIDKG
jgi:uncharacterized Tic20 family protein